MQLLALLCLALYGGVSPSIAQQARLASSTALADYFDPRRHGGSMLAHFEAYNHVGEPLNVTGLKNGDTARLNLRKGYHLWRFRPLSPARYYSLLERGGIPARVSKSTFGWPHDRKSWLRRGPRTLRDTPELAACARDLRRICYRWQSPSGSARRCAIPALTEFCPKPGGRTVLSQILGRTSCQ